MKGSVSSSPISSTNGSEQFVYPSLPQQDPTNVSLTDKLSVELPVSRERVKFDLAVASPDVEEEAVAEEEEDELLSRWDMAKLCIPVIPSQLGWAVGEALLIPYLMSLGLEETVANGIWLVNPLVGFFVQPLVGAASDRCQSKWGRRRPFLIVFHFGIILGLAMIGFAPELHALLLPNTPLYDVADHAQLPLLFIIFSGCVIMELSNDLLTIPSRALLNDCLPVQQIDQGNAYFSAMNSLGAVLGLVLCFLPLNQLFPLSLLDTQLRATFVMCIVIILSSNFFTMTIDEYTEEGEGEEDDTAIGDVDGDVDEGRALLSVEDEEYDISEDHTEDEEADAIPDEQIEGEEGETVLEEHHLSIAESLLAFRLLPPVLVAIWFVQFTWWLVVMQISFWWTTWVGIVVFQADPIESSELFYEGVTYGIIGTLLHSVVSFFASHFLTSANNKFGVTRVYHASAVIYSFSTMLLWWFRSREATMAYMIFTGVLYPVINTNPFILIEVYTGYDETEEEATDEPEKSVEKESLDEVATTGTESISRRSEAETDHSGIPIPIDDMQLPLVSPLSEIHAAELESELSSLLRVTDPDLLANRSSFGEDSVTETETEFSESESEVEAETASSTATHGVSTIGAKATDEPLYADISTSESEGSESEHSTEKGGRHRPAPISRSSAMNLAMYGYEPDVYHSQEPIINVTSPSNFLLPSEVPNTLSIDPQLYTQNSPHSPPTPTSPLTPLISPGMIAAVAADVQNPYEGPTVPISSGLLPETTFPLPTPLSVKPPSPVLSSELVNSTGDDVGEEVAEEGYLSASTHRGVLTAIMNLSMGLSQIISATIGGMIIKWWGDITIVFLVSGILSILTNLLVVGLSWSTVPEEVEEVEEGDMMAQEPEHVAETESQVRVPVDRFMETPMRKGKEEIKFEDVEKLKREREIREQLLRDRILRQFVRKADRRRSMQWNIPAEPFPTPISPLNLQESKREYGTFGQPLSPYNASLIGTSAPARIDISQTLRHDQPKRAHHRHRRRDHAIDILQPTSSASVATASGAAPTMVTPIPKHRKPRKSKKSDISLLDAFPDSAARSQLLYEITVLLQFYHVHRITELPLQVQQKIKRRLRQHIQAYRRQKLRIDADISSRRGLTGRYAQADEVKTERERLHIEKQHRRRRRKERKLRQLQQQHEFTDPSVLEK